MNEKQLLNDNVTNLLKQGNSFDFVRYFFSFTLVVAHFCTLADMNIAQLLFGSDQSDHLNNYILIGGIRVKVFFVLSGFLIFYSYAKKQNIKEYINKRLRRIYPAYIFIIILCVLCGIFLTNLTTLEYITSPETYKYLAVNAGFMNFLQPCLPGVFETNPYQPVNGSLWTMKVEVMFYISVPIVFYLLKKYNKLAVLVGILLFSILYNQLFTYLYNSTGNELYLLIRKQIGSQFVYFYSGTFILIYFDYFNKYLKYLFPVAILIFIFQREHIILNYLEPMSIAIIIIGFAYRSKCLNFLRKYDNVSYGIYLFHFPIIQTVIHFGLHKTNPILAFFVSLTFTVLLAILSWKYIEKPIITYKKGKKTI